YESRPYRESVLEYAVKLDEALVLVSEYIIDILRGIARHLSMLFRPGLEINHLVAGQKDADQRGQDRQNGVADISGDYCRAPSIFFFDRGVAVDVTSVGPRKGRAESLVVFKIFLATKSQK